MGAGGHTGDGLIQLLSSHEAKPYWYLCYHEYLARQFLRSRSYQETMAPRGGRNSSLTLALSFKSLTSFEGKLFLREELEENSRRFLTGEQMSSGEQC